MNFYILFCQRVPFIPIRRTGMEKCIVTFQLSGGFLSFEVEPYNRSDIDLSYDLLVKHTVDDVYCRSVRDRNIGHMESEVNGHTPNSGTVPATTTVSIKIVHLP